MPKASGGTGRRCPCPSATGRMDGWGSLSLTAAMPRRLPDPLAPLGAAGSRLGGKVKPAEAWGMGASATPPGPAGEGKYPRSAGAAPSRSPPARGSRAEHGAAGAQGLAGRGKPGTLGLAGRDSRGRRPVGRVGAEATPVQAPARREAVASSADLTARGEAGALRPESAAATQRGERAKGA